MLRQREGNLKKFLWEKTVRPAIVQLCEAQCTQQVLRSSSSSSSLYKWVLDVSSRFFVIFKLGRDIYGKTHLKKCVPYFVKTSIFKTAGRTSNFKTHILAFSKMQFQIKSQCQTHVYIFKFLSENAYLPREIVGPNSPYIN